MKVIRSQRTVIAVSIATALGVFGGPAARAAVITWGTSTTISADTDVSTNGTFVTAINLGFLPGGAVANVVLNGVTFTGSAFGGLTPTNILQPDVYGLDHKQRL